MKSFILRFIALALRFLCPITALALSSAETMGKYYLFLSYFTFFVGVSSLELAVPFSRNYLRCKNDRQRRHVFSGFIESQLAVSALIGLISGALISVWCRLPPYLIPFIYFSLVSECCVNEVGRFYQNIGEWHMPSKREFIRSSIFTIAIMSSLIFKNDILTVITFTIIFVGNFLIIFFESRHRGKLYNIGFVNLLESLRRKSFRIKRSLSRSIPQFVQMQFLSIQPLLERVIIEQSLGLSAVGGISFISSCIQSGGGLLLVPIIAKTRYHMLGAINVSQTQDSGRQAIKLFLMIILISIGSILVMYASLPLLTRVVEKDVPITFLFIAVAFISSVSAIFCSAISPMIIKDGYGWIANKLSLIALLPILFIIFLNKFAQSQGLGVGVIIIVAVVQISGRLIFITNVKQTYKKWRSI